MFRIQIFFQSMESADAMDIGHQERVEVATDVTCPHVSHADGKESVKCCQQCWLPFYR